MTLAILLSIGFVSKAQQQIKILNAFQYYKIQASNDYSQLQFLVRDDGERLPLEEAYFNDWEDAFLVVSEREIYSIKARYHIFDDAFYMKLNGEQKSIYPHVIQGIVFRNRIFVSRKEMLDSGLKDGYYELLSDGKKELLKKRIYKYKINRDGVVKLGAQKTFFCIKDNQGLIKKLDLAPEKIFDTFGKYQMMVRNYAKENTLNPYKASDLKRLFDYYNHALAKK